MTKMFKKYVLNIFIMIVFFLSQIVNVNANHLRNNSQKENISISLEKQGRKKVISMATLYVPDLNYGVENKATIEGKIEKVLEPITLGTFGVAMLSGYGTAIVGMVIGWVINCITALIKSSPKHL
ncbi:hypothetical protein [Bartonella taylorii]|uniref:hypothetical protein n=1 Tax=Bartonella taylorii TaxID=33046 RepID=UPI001ABB54D5|nr:hypothetical protein [Bartonella taylorii]